MDWLKATGFAVNVGAPWGVSVATTQASDPFKTVTAKAYCDPPSQVPVSLRFPAAGFQTKIVLNASGCTDGVVVIYDNPTGTPHQLRQYDWSNGNPTAGQYRTWDIKGLGHGTRMGGRLGTSASGVAALFGVLRSNEMNAPGRKIEHALQMALPAHPGCNVMLSKDILLPAVSRDNGASNPANNLGHIPYGALLALPPSVNIDSLGLSEPGKRLAQAIRDYGIYVVDTGGCSNGAIRADQYVDKSKIKADITKIYPLIRRVLNNDVLGSPVAGGGDPLAPNCAFDAL
jgi:hypothetical protein